MDRPVTTLFMLMSLDGKISTGASDALDFDRDLPHVPSVAEGLYQYYELEQQTDLWSLNTGRVMAKIGANELPLPKKDSRFVCHSGQYAPVGGGCSLALCQVPASRHCHLQCGAPGL